MPADAFEGSPGGILSWDNPNQEHWYPAPSAVDGNLAIPNTNYDFQHQFISANSIDSHLNTTANRADDVFANDQPQKFELDVHQGQHWSDLSSQHHAIPPPHVALLGNTTGVGTAQFSADESPHNSVGSVAKIPPSQAPLRKGSTRDSTIVSNSAATSPSRSITSAPKPHGSEPKKPQRVNRPQREAPPSKPPSQNGSEYRSPNAAPGSFDRKKHPLPKGKALNRMLSMDVAEGRDEDESRNNQLGGSARGGSTVSSASGQSRGENHASRSDGQDDEYASTLSRTEKKGIVNTPGVLRTRPGFEVDDGQHSLPHAKGFSIQIGSELFKLSGASIMSDGQYSHFVQSVTRTENSRAPSYFSRFFEEQLQQHDDGSGALRTLYIDRDPSTFQDICRHLQGKAQCPDKKLIRIQSNRCAGYYVQPRDGAHFVRLFADAQFYSCTSVGCERILRIG